MTTPRRTSLLLGLALAALLAVTPAALARAPRIGIGDQKPATFADPRFEGLHIRYSRLLIPWDVTEHRSEMAATGAWLRAARRAGVRPLISFTRSRQKGRGQVVPSTRRYVRDFKRFHRRWRWVRDFSIWNEPNLCSRNPTCTRFGRLVAYYKAVRRACRRCHVTPGEVIDIGNMRAWVRRFERRLGHRPQFWGLHNYRDANRRRTRSTVKLLKVTRAPIWITEIGGLVRHTDKPSRHFTESARHAARVTRWIFERIIPLSPRIRRVYFYNWSVPTDTETWDSAFIGPEGPRPSYRIFKRQLRRLRG